MTVILGSSSPRRKDLLGTILPDFIIRKPDTDESVLPGETASDYCTRVAIAKREALLPLDNGNNTLLISCDTTVAFENHILGKPVDHADAVRMLSILQGRTHQVISSIALYAQIDGKIVRDTGSETTHVTFRSLDISRIEAYLKEVHVFDKAGSYAAQERADMIIDTIEGSTTNVIGLPMRLLYSLIVKNNLITALFP